MHVFLIQEYIYCACIVFFCTYNFKSYTGRMRIKPATSKLPVAPPWLFLSLLAVTALLVPGSGSYSRLCSMCSLPSLLNLSSVPTPIWFSLEFIFERGVRICFTFLNEDDGLFRCSLLTTPSFPYSPAVPVPSGMQPIFSSRALFWTLLCWFTSCTCTSAVDACDSSLHVWWSKSPTRFFLRHSWTLSVPLLFDILF